MRDTNLQFNSNVIIAATQTSAILDWGEAAAKGVWVEIAHTGVVGGTAAELTAWLEFSDSSTFAGNTINSARIRGPDLVRNQNATGFRFSRLCQTRFRYARVQYTVAGTTPSFTGIYAHVVSGPQTDDVAGVNAN